MSAVLPITHSWHEVFSHALRGATCRVHGLADAALPLPVHAWRAHADSSDQVVLDHCADPTLDIGCGPGRMTHGLLAAGKRALGIDVVGEAVRQARSRGAVAIERDVFGPLPGEGRWPCALLADGNIGIGGDPERLLARVGQVIAEGGHVVVDLAPPGFGVRTREVRIECRGACSETFAWSVVGADSVRDVARRAGYGSIDLHEHKGRWFAVLGHPGEVES